MSVTNFYLILSNCIYQQSVRPVTFFYILFPKKCPALNTLSDYSIATPKSQIFSVKSITIVKIVGLSFQVFN